MEKITYLVANYNNDQYLKECIESLLAQTSDKWRCIIYDDGSTDNSIDIIQSYISDTIQLIKGGKNEGKINALKVMVKQSQTDIVGILDSDDMLHPDTTREILNVYEKDGNASFVYSKCAYMDQTLAYVFNQYGSYVKLGNSCFDKGFISSLRTFRKKIYYKTSGFDEDILYAEDLDLNYKLEEIAIPILVDRMLYKYRRVGDSQTHNAEKRIVGAKNHVKARKNALLRRKVSRLNKLYNIMSLYIENKAYMSSYGYKRDMLYMIIKLMNYVYLRINSATVKNK